MPRPLNLNRNILRDGEAELDRIAGFGRQLLYWKTTDDVIEVSKQDELPKIAVRDISKIELVDLNATEKAGLRKAVAIKQHVDAYGVDAVRKGTVTLKSGKVLPNVYMLLGPTIVFGSEGEEWRMDNLKIVRVALK